MVFDPSISETDLKQFPRENRVFSIYSTPGEELKKLLPPNMLRPLGKEFVLRVYVDADHAGETLT